MYKITLTRVEVLDFKTRKDMFNFVRSCGVSRISLGEEVAVKSNQNSLIIRYDKGRKSDTKKEIDR